MRVDWQSDIQQSAFDDKQRASVRLVLFRHPWSVLLVIHERGCVYIIRIQLDPGVCLLAADNT